MHEVSLDQRAPCEDNTFYVDGVEIENYVDCVESQDSEQDEGFVTIHKNDKPNESEMQCDATGDF